MNPKVSVIMGIYNCESTLRESIDSILGQTYDNWELIMCDDSENKKAVTDWELLTQPTSRIYEKLLVNYKLCVPSMI